MITLSFQNNNKCGMKCIFTVLMFLCYASGAVIDLGSKNISEGWDIGCFDYGDLENGNVTVIDNNNFRTLHFICLPGFELIGRPKVFCNDGQWENLPKPACVRAGGCTDPPMLGNGEVKIEGYKEGELYAEGVVAEYQCMDGFQLTPPLKHRVCQKGQWNGSDVSCYPKGCSSPPIMLNGYFEPKTSVNGYYNEGTVLHYRCDVGFVLQGSTTIHCQGRKWSHQIFPQCLRIPQEESLMCQLPPLSPHVVLTTLRGLQSTYTALAGTTLEAKCTNGYRDEHSPCVPQILRCVEGVWEGRMPSCVTVEGCIYPLSIPHATILKVGLQTHSHYAVGSQVAYSCAPGYDLVGDAVFTCQSDGCWDPEILPVCHPTSHFYINTSAWSEYLSWNTSLLISMVTVASVLFILLSVCVVVMCRHHHHSHHNHHGGPTQPALAPPPPDPDRVALIAFADGVQSVLPSYEEAVRSGVAGSGGVLNYRLHRPHWTMLGASARRNNRDNNHISRQTSSAGDSMGSTDTMTVSEVSTNVTLDTVSSHTCSSGSQTASCRAICGSLASFDTSSVLNTEGVPLLEESELEETGTGSNPGGIVHDPDNGSFKLQPDIVSIHS